MSPVCAPERPKIQREVRQELETIREELEALLADAEHGYSSVALRIGLRFNVVVDTNQSRERPDNRTANWGKLETVVAAVLVLQATELVFTPKNRPSPGRCNLRIVRLDGDVMHDYEGHSVGNIIHSIVQLFPEDAKSTETRCPHCGK